MTQEKNTRKMKFRVILSNTGYMLTYIWRSAPLYLVIKLISCVLNVLEYYFITLMLIQNIINALINEFQMQDILRYLVIILCFKVFKTIFDGFVNSLYYPSQQLCIEKYMRQLIYNKFVRIKAKRMDDPEFFNEYSLAVDAALAQVHQVLEQICGFFYNLSVWVISYFIVVNSIAETAGQIRSTNSEQGFIGIILFVATFLPALFSIPITTKINKIMYAQEVALRPSDRKISYINRVFYLKEFAKDLKSSNIKNILWGHLQQSSLDWGTIQKQYGKKCFYLMVINETLGYFVQFMQYVYMFYCVVISGTMILGNAFSYQKSSDKVLTSFPTQNLQEIYKLTLYIENLNRYLEEEEEAGGSQSLSQEWHNITFQNLSFQYENSHKKILHNLNLTIKRGEKIAIVGKNGVGKSTFVKLLMRLYQPTEGEILLDGIPLEDYDLKQYRKQVGYVPQDYKVYAVSAMENVLMRPILDIDTDSQLATYSLNQCGLLNKILSYPNAIHSNITKEFDDNGIILSKGQEQKLAISRIFPATLSLLILDEPTSALDPIAEDEIQRIILEQIKDQTVIFIAHRLSTVRNADRIYLINEGQIVEEGTHKFLMQQGGMYYNMFTVQAERYQDDD